MKKRWYRRFLIMVLLFGLFVGADLVYGMQNRCILRKKSAQKRHPVIC